jgi:hypothetical protein
LPIKFILPGGVEQATCSLDIFLMSRKIRLRRPEQIWQQLVRILPEQRNKRAHLPCTQPCQLSHAIQKARGAAGMPDVGS